MVLVTVVIFPLPFIFFCACIVLIVSIAINKKYILNNTQLNDGDEIAFIPPVQGG